MRGEVSFAQTHVIRQTEERWAPALTTHRAMTLLFEPETVVDVEQEMRISAWKDGEIIGSTSDELAR